MRIAVACSGLNIAPRYDLAESLTFYTVTKGIITECQNIPFPRISQEELLDFFLSNEVVALICNAIVIDHAQIYCKNDISVVAGVSGDARSAVEKYVSRTLRGMDELCNWGDEAASQQNLNEETVYDF